MSKKTFARVTKTMAILLAVLFLVTVTVVSVNAATIEQGNKSDDHADKYKHGDNYGQDYKDGNNYGQDYKDGNSYGQDYKDGNSYGQDYRDGDKYRQGYKDGYSEGLNDGRKDCNKYGSKEILNKIPDPTYKDKSYSRDFILGYTTGYNEKRYLCLQKINMLKK
jgi:hypothetical protein